MLSDFAGSNFIPYTLMFLKYLLKVVSPVSPENVGLNMVDSNNLSNEVRNDSGRWQRINIKIF